MPWPPNGDYYVFKEESIKAKAPPVSGVFGLYDLKRYILIGESADLRAALLHHEKETGFWFGLYRPIGFTFEVCPAALRAARAEELIVEYRPALQKRAFFAHKPRRRREIESASAGVAAKDRADRPRPISSGDEGKETVRRFYFSRDQLWVVALAFAVTALCVGVLGILTGKKIEATRIVQNDVSPRRVPADPAREGPEPAPGAQAEEGPTSPMASMNELDAQRLSKEPTTADRLREGFQGEIKELKPKSVFKTNGPTAAQQRAEKVGERSASLPAVKEARQHSQAAKAEEPGKGWAIQVRASPDKSAADLWAVTLKTRGYNAFVVPADIKGRTWYRVRVGPFDTREEAETSRLVLQSKEGFGDAFVTN